MIVPSLEMASVPEILRDSVSRWWERASQQSAIASAYGRLTPLQQCELARVIACSEFIGAALLQDPDALEWLRLNEEPSASSAASLDFQRRMTEAPGLKQAQHLLRVWRRRAMLQIAWHDIVGHTPVAETLHALSDLADAGIRAACLAAEDELAGVFGQPRDLEGQIVPFIVLGMGKLGGRELNFSSDIDLIFLFGAAGETDGARTVDNQEYFNRLGGEIIRLLDVRTEDGFVFRVDMRLRPFGESGSLVVSLAALEEYLQQHGRDWERYAWIKARAIVGADAYAASSQEFIRPFVYRRYLDFGVFESLRDMKALITREVSRRDLERHLKLGSGGIREIEFITQSFQLVRGGSDRRLQNASLLDVLPVLAGAKLIPGEAVDALTDAYLVLRKAENALQMIRDEQAHVLPTEVIDQARLALIMGFTTWQEAADMIALARRNTAQQFELLIFGAKEPLSTNERLGASGSPSTPANHKADANLAWLGADGVRIDEELASIGFPVTDISSVAALLEGYRITPAYGRLDETGRRRLYRVLSRMLGAAAEHAKPTLVVERVLKVLEAIGTRSSYLALLVEQPAALGRLIEVCAISGFLTRRIAEYPLLLDELIDAKAFDELPSRAGFVRELEARTQRLPVDDPERQVEALRQFQKVAVFSVALADQTGRLPLMKVSDRLTDIAELIVQFCMDLAWRQMTQAYGVPMCADAAGVRVVQVAVAGYGKLGGIELGYGSDLDLVFLHDSCGDQQMTQGERAIDNGLFFLRLGQRIVHLLTMHSAAGRLYEVDTRLRPNGKGGFLITGIDAFESYQDTEAWTWEHQALLRARAVAGAPELCLRFEAARRRALCVSVRRDSLRTEVLEMRERMRRELSKAKAGEFDLKQDLGGIADIEFLVQYWVLAAAKDHPQLADYTDNIRQLEGLAAVGVLDNETAVWLMQAYRDYRGVLHHLSLEGQGERVVSAAVHSATRARIAQIWSATFDVL